MTHSIVSTAGLFEPNRSGLHVDDYDYPLSEALIARYPLPERDSARMLVLNRKTGEIAHHSFQDLPNFLAAGDLLTLNNTKVLPARFYGNRRGLTGRVEILMLHPEGDADGCVWSALMRPARKLKPGTMVELPNTQATLEVLSVGERGCCQVRVHPAEHGDVPTLMAEVGLMPIPPYLRRDPEESDKERYQTVFAKVPGAQAAPTASLHFTPQMLERLQTQGVNRAEVTLSVSSGTFRTVEDDDIRAHQMDPEAYTVPSEAAQAVQETRKNGGRVLAVGTTVAKTLETVAAESAGEVSAGSGWSKLYIYPGFQFQAVDMLLTNFHLPKSTLLMLISAFAGREQIANAYREALDQGYRFYSYGDCMLIV
ncbi:tRNA preQ1(34) S-adenosylmethionine ribosyltransferase-isomerase QueA [Vampirovibrio sp.]|uniref:tRNA preQ1(34) S-adenosylmethionine ribosyltransferase-isomerase QueA n=1 Tax=Vampirovibrio sp. TaxID=2717857 RepID=UPI003592EF8D